MIRALLAAALLALPFGAVACCKPEIRYVQVQVPCPAPVLQPRPRLPIENRTPAWTDKQREDALWESLALAVGWGKAQEVQLRKYLPAPKETQR